MVILYIVENKLLFYCSYSIPNLCASLCWYSVPNVYAFDTICLCRCVSPCRHSIKCVYIIFCSIDNLLSVKHWCASTKGCASLWCCSTSYSYQLIWRSP